MRNLIIAIALLSLSGCAKGSTMLVGVAHAKDYACWKKKGEPRILACTRIIKSGHLFGKPISKSNLARMYYNRGNAYMKKGQSDQAIADYDKAIEFNPKYEKAYAKRRAASRALNPS